MEKNRVLVPIPRSAPLSGTSALWPTFRICEELVRAGLGASVSPALRRVTAVTKAATARKGQRPIPEQHYESVTVVHDLPFADMSHITLVDDVITRGSTMIGMFGRIVEAFPESEIRCFTLVRTVSDGDVEKIECPTVGKIEYRPPSATSRTVGGERLTNRFSQPLATRQTVGQFQILKLFIARPGGAVRPIPLYRSHLMNIFSLSHLLELVKELPDPKQFINANRGRSFVIRLPVRDWDAVRDADHPDREFEAHENPYVEFEIIQWKNTKGVSAPRWVLRGLVAM